MRHAGDSDELLEVTSDELGPVVRDDAWLCFRVLLLGSLQDHFDVGLPHGLPQIPMHEETTEPIQNAAQVIEGPADIDGGSSDYGSSVGLWNSPRPARKTSNDLLGDVDDRGMQPPNGRHQGAAAEGMRKVLESQPNYVHSQRRRQLAILEVQGKPLPGQLLLDVAARTTVSGVAWGFDDDARRGERAWSPRSESLARQKKPVI